MDKLNKFFSTSHGKISTLALVLLLAIMFLFTSLANISLSKQDFVCTKIEQVGKNLDDVNCVQYTHNKFYQETLAVNKSIDVISKMPVVEPVTSPSTKKK